MTEFGDRLKAARKKAGLSQKALDERVGSHINTIASYERNEKEPSLGKIRLIGNLLQCDLNWLVYGKSLGEKDAEWQTEGAHGTGAENGMPNLINRLKKLNVENQEIISDIVNSFLRKQGKK